MAKNKRVEVQKGAKRKFIYENELSSYLAMGWVKVSFPNNNVFNKIK